MGRMRMISPAKATRQHIEKQGWTFYEWDIDLAKDALCGPFDFMNMGQEPHHIPKEAWNRIHHEAAKRGIYTADMDKVVPLN